MVKKYSALYLIIVFLSMNIIPVFASTSNVIDDIDFLTNTEETVLNNQIDEIKSEYELEPVIVFIDDSNVSDSIAYADDYFDYNDFGIGEDKEGILFLVDMYNRQLVISTTGPNTIKRYEFVWTEMRDILSPYLTSGAYNKACLKFLEMVINVEKTGKVTTYGYRLVNMAKNPIPYIIGLIAALIATVVITLSSKGKVTITDRTYEISDSFHLTHKVDQYLREHTTKRKIETKSSSGGRTGSSGSSHGGGGGGF